MTDSQIPPFVGPHEDRELELLLAGTKPMAFLNSEPTVGFYQDLSAFQPHVANGTLIQVDAPWPDGTVITHYFCLPTEEWRIKVMELLKEAMNRPDRGGLTNDDIDRIRGNMLGYAKADTEAFLLWRKAR